MNFPQILKAGLIVGLILNIGEALLHAVFLADQTLAIMQKYQLPMSGPGLGLALLVLITFVQGVIGMWLYAAVSPNVERGPWAAARVGILLWILSSVYSGVYFYGGFPALLGSEVTWLPVAWDFFEYPLAMIAGAAFFDRRKVR